MSLTLTDYRTLIRNEVRDTASAVWTDAQLDAALLSALHEYSVNNPLAAIGTVTLSSSSREVSLTSLTRLFAPLEIWLPYTAADPEEPPNQRVFILLTPTTARILDYEPTTGDVARVFYAQRHTINGLDGATATTVPEHHERYLSIGAAVYLLRGRARQLGETENVAASVRFASQRLAKETSETWDKFLATLAGAGLFIHWAWQPADPSNRRFL